MDIRQPRKSMLGHRNTYIESSQRKFEILPKNLRVAESFKSQRTTSNSENILTLNLKNKTRQPRKSMLGSHKLRRDSIIPPLSESLSLLLTTENNHSKFEYSSFADTTTNNEFKTNNDSFIENETVLANEESVLATTIIDTSVLNDVANTSAQLLNDERTVVQDNTTESNKLSGEDDMLFKMLDMMNTWIQRNTESIDMYQKQRDELDEKIASAKEEIENIKNLKQTLIKKFSVGDKENIPLHSLDSKPMATITEDEVFKGPAVSPTKQVIQEMRSTIKFLKTPRMSRAPRASVLLTPHSLSFCIKSQYEQLFE